MQRFVNFEKKNGNLVLTLNDDGKAFIAEALEDGKNIGSDAFESDLLEWHLCNGWERVAPEDIGGLTSGLIITDDCERDDHGKLTACGRVYWHERYQVDAIAERLYDDGTGTGVVTFLGRE